MKRIFLAVDPLRFASTFCYLLKDNCSHSLERGGISFTADIDDSFDEAVAFSADDFFAFYSAIHKRNIPFALMACQDSDDFMKNRVPGANKDCWVLSQNAFSCYQRASKLFVFFPSQVTFLRRTGITTPVEMIKPCLTFDENGLISNREKAAFRSFYTVTKNRPVIVSFGSYGNIQDFNLLDGIGRANPDKMFLFFGHSGRDFIRQKLVDRMAGNEITNVTYVNVLPEELYHSALRSVDGVLLIQGLAPYPTALIDFMAHRVPIISYGNSELPELINPNTALIAEDFPSLFHALGSLSTTNKAAEAYSFVKSFVINCPLLDK